MRKYMVLVALFALGLLPSATKAEVEARTALQVVKPPTLKCSIASVRLIGSSVVATGGCTIGTKTVLAKFVKWTWIQKSADLSGAACQFGSGRGTGKRSSLLAYPAGIPRISGSALPGLLNATFTVTARWNKKTVKRSKSFRKTTADSHVLCGAPPKLVSLDGPTPSALTWATPPTFDGTILRANTVESRGNGQCRWLKPQFLVQGVYLTHTTSDFSCDNGYGGGIGVNVSYSIDGPAKCKGFLQHVNSFAIPGNWGTGGVYLTLEVATWDERDKQFPYVGNDTNPNSYNYWRIPNWVDVYGDVDPCTTDLR